jgi:hypothetical protein
MLYRTLLLPVVAALALLASGCGGETEPEEVILEGIITGNFSVMPSATGENVPFDATVLIELSDHPDFAPYAGKISSVEVADLSFQVLNYSAPAGAAVYIPEGTVGFGAPGATSPVAACNFAFLPVTDWAGTDPFELLECNAIRDQAAGLLGQHEQVQVLLEGTVTRAPVRFDLLVILDLRLRAEALP